MKGEGEKCLCKREKEREIMRQEGLALLWSPRVYPSSIQRRVKEAAFRGVVQEEATKQERSLCRFPISPSI